MTWLEKIKAMEAGELAELISKCDEMGGFCDIACRACAYRVPYTGKLADDFGDDYGSCTAHAKKCSEAMYAQLMREVPDEIAETV